VLGYQAALSLDTIIQTGLHGTITSQFAGSATTEATTSAVITAAEIRRAVFKLKKIGARELTGGYAGCFHPASAFDIMSDTAVGGWLDVNKYTVTGPTYNGEIGKIYGCRIVESQNIQTGTGASSATTYRNFVFGKQCYGLVDLAGHNLKMIAKQLGTSGAFDPLDQLSTVGYKFSFVLAILDAFRGIEVIGCTSAS
jgi:N4-gp56 family major capsid protein